MWLGLLPCLASRTIYKMATAGDLPGVKVGKEWRFARRNLINWVAQSPNNEADDLASLLKNASIRARKA